MLKLKVNAIIDILMAIFFIIVVINSIVLFVYFPHSQGGYQGGKNSVYLTSFFGLTKIQWTDFHINTGFALIALMALHLLLHLNYYRCIPLFFKSEKNQKRNKA